MAGPGGREVGRVSVRVVPNTSGFSRELMAELKAIERTALVNIRTNLDSDQLVGEARRAVTAAEKGAVVNVGADFDAGSLGQDARRAVSDAEAAAGKVDVGATFDDGGLVGDVNRAVSAAEARAGVVQIEADLDANGIAAEARAAVEAAELAAGSVTVPVRLDQRQVQQDAVTLGRTMNGLVASAIVLGPALIPLATGLAAVFLAAAGPLAAATAGLGAFAILAVPTIKSVVDASAELEEAQKKVTEAISDKERSAALLELQALTESLSPATLAAVGALDAVKQGFADLREVLQDDIMAVFNAGLGVATAALPAIGELAKAAAPALVQVADGLAAAFNRTGVDGFVGFLSGKAASAILGFATGLGNIVQGFGSIIVAFDPVSRSIGGGLDGLLEKFSAIGESAGFRQFVGYVQSVGPLVVDTLGSVFRAVGAIVIAFAPLGTVALVVIRGLADGINAIPLPVLTVLAGLFVLIATAAVAANTVLAIQTLVFGLQAAAAVASAAATTALGVAMAILTSPITAVIVVIAGLVAGLVLAYNTSETFRDIVNAVWDAVKAAAVAVFDFLKGYLSGVFGFYKALFTGDFGEARRIVEVAFDAIKSKVTAVFDAVKGFLSDALGSIRDSFSGAWDSVESATSGAFDALKTTISGAIDAVVGFIGDLPGRAVGVLASLAGLLLGVAGGAWLAFRGATEGGISGLLGLIGGLPGQVVGALGNLGSLLYNSGRSIISGLVDGIRSMAGAVKDAVSGVLSAARNLLPFSPAKEGPFSGRGWTTYSGAAIVDGLISGIESREAAAVRATSGLASNMSGALEVEGTVASSATTREATLDEVVARLDRLTVVVERMPREQQTMRRRR